jgi:membrane protein DedA with SNARE-associated domain
VNALFSLQVGSVISYAIAVLVPALDAIFPVLPSETAIIALGVATAGSADPRIALLVACLCCGIIGYDRRRFVVATAVAATIWAFYSFFVGRLGGKVFEDTPWAGFAVAFGITIAVSGLIEAIRRIRSRGARAVARDGALKPRSGRGHAGQVEAHDPGENQSDRHELQGGHRVAEEDHAPYRGSGGADPRPYRVRGTDLELA